MAKRKNEIKVSFVDSMSANGVTGSNVYIETPNHKILLDCGMHQSNNKKEDYLINNRRTKEYKPKELDLIFISHQHADHQALCPKYYKDGFRGGIVVPKGSTETLKRMCFKMEGKKHDTATFTFSIDLSNLSTTENIPIYVHFDKSDKGLKYWGSTVAGFWVLGLGVKKIMDKGTYEKSWRQFNIQVIE